MQRGFRMCKHPGCPKLVENAGYCEKHMVQHKNDSRQNFKALDTKKTPEQKKFYSSAAWTAASLYHRQIEPLCRRCKAQGKIEFRNLAVHHNPSYDFLVSNGLNPLSDKYLETICVKHHMEELRKKNLKKVT
ncbi:MAG: hypothetical protein JW915_24210 [Chitinispirillaceae bacterium]|nr:hypothetical protein [Chitinispirillaceae bacterium]